MDITSVTEVKPNPNIPTVTPGDTVRVSAKVVEGDKERTQVFRGVVVRMRRSGIGSSLTVRRVTYGVGVERTFPLYSPRLEKVEVLRHGKTRRAKLYYLRELSAKASRLKEKRVEREEKAELEKAPEEKAPEAKAE